MLGNLNLRIVLVPLCTSLVRKIRELQCLAKRLHQEIVALQLIKYYKEFQELLGRRLPRLRGVHEPERNPSRHLPYHDEIL
jgi:hypothetical protein